MISLKKKTNHTKTPDAADSVSGMTGHAYQGVVLPSPTSQCKDSGGSGIFPSSFW